MEVNGQFESVCESVFSELESKAVEALDLPMPGCFRMRSHSYVRAIERGCSQDDECLSLRSASPPRTTTTVRTIQSSTGTFLSHLPHQPYRITPRICGACLHVSLTVSLCWAVGNNENDAMFYNEIIIMKMKLCLIMKFNNEKIIMKMILCLTMKFNNEIIVIKMMLCFSSLIQCISP